MKILVDLSESEVTALDELANAANLSRESLIRKAVTSILSEKASAPLTDAYGLWGTSVVDGMDYQDALRREW